MYKAQPVSYQKFFGVSGRLWKTLLCRFKIDTAEKPEVLSRNIVKNISTLSIRTDDVEHRDPETHF